MNLKTVKDNALKYLGYQGQVLDNDFELLFNECLEEVIANADFKVVSNRYNLNHHPLKIESLNINLDYNDLNKLLDNCKEVVIAGYTLGLNLEKRLRYLSKINMTKMTIMDAISSSYLEYLSDEYDNSIIKDKRTFRFCPGYGDVSISLNRDIANILNTNKYIGVMVSDSDLLIPQKSMIGIIGIGDNQMIKNCMNCINIKHCSYRKRGQRCYQQD